MTPKSTLRGIVGLVLVLVLSACSQPAPTAPALPPTDAVTDVPSTAVPPTAEPTPAATSQPEEASSLPAQALEPFTVDLASPFAGEVTLASWDASAYGGSDPALPVDLNAVDNVGVIAGLTPEQRTFLSQNGFVILHTQEPQFGTIREQMKSSGQPYYLTTDAALHSMHLDFDEALKALEREIIRTQMIDIIKVTLAEVQSYQPELAGTSVGADEQLAGQYLAVALRLFDPEANLDPALEAAIQPQIEQIMAYDGQAPSALIPNFEDDYGAYRPVGHYAGDEALEKYFRGMTWLGRVHFGLKSPEGDPAFKPSRVPLIVTLALRRAELDGAPASEAWAEVHEVLSFVVGPSDDAGPLEYANLMDEIYGASPAPGMLADDALWAEFQSRADELPSPQINSTFLAWARELPDAVGWRLMGQRFTLDGYIFQQLVFDNVEINEAGERRNLPTGPDVAAVFGSPVGLEAVSIAGMDDYPNYLDQVALLQGEVEQRPQEEWQQRFYDSWLYTFLSVLEDKDSAYPPYMQGDLWAYKEMNTMLASWAELKHDTILYSKMPEGYGGGGPPTSGPAPSVVEPNPEAFYRMAYMVNSLVTGLRERDMGSSDVPPSPDNLSLSRLMSNMESMASRFNIYGGIAAKELVGEPLTEDDYQYILYSCLSVNECLPEQQSDPTEVPLVAAVAGGGESVLEAATGYVDRMYVVVNINGQLTIAQGGVYSYYEFTQPRADRLTDEAWQEKLSGPDAPNLPAWSSTFLLLGGETVSATAFRVGDIYTVTEVGDHVNLRSGPSVDAEVLTALPAGIYFDITEGPVGDDDGNTWWKIHAFTISGSNVYEGWVVENQDWYSRSS